MKPLMYIVSFFIPVILMLIAYAFFGIYPFGERSVLALDLNGQYIYYFEHIRDVFWGDDSLFYSWGRDLSGEFMGIIGYYLASPFTIMPLLTNDFAIPSVNSFMATLLMVYPLAAGRKLLEEQIFRIFPSTPESIMRRATA